MGITWWFQISCKKFSLSAGLTQFVYILLGTGVNASCCARLYAGVAKEQEMSFSNFVVELLGEALSGSVCVTGHAEI